MIFGNIDGHGNLDTNKMKKALLQYRNTPNATTGMSPAYTLYERQLGDALPSIPLPNRDPTTVPYFERYGKPGTVWNDIKSKQDIAYAKKRSEATERYNSDKHCLPALSVGDSVTIQNRSGSHPLC